MSGGVWNAMLLRKERHAVASLDKAVVGVEALSRTKSCRWFDSPCGGGSRQGLVTDVVFILASIGDRGRYSGRSVYCVDSVGWSFVA